MATLTYCHTFIIILIVLEPHLSTHKESIATTKFLWYVGGRGNISHRK